MKICRFCDDATDEQELIAVWLKLVRARWQEAPLLKRAFEYSYPFLAGFTLLCSVAPALQDYASVPLSLLVIVYGLGEFVPLAPMPLGANNAFVARARDTVFTSAASVMSELALFALLAVLLQELFSPSNFQDSLERYLSVCTFAIPVVLLMFLLFARIRFSVAGRPAARKSPAQATRTPARQ